MDREIRDFTFYKVIIICDKGHRDHYSFRERTFTDVKKAVCYSDKLFYEGSSNCILRITTYANQEIGLEVFRI